jgi:hypothetical protein
VNGGDVRAVRFKPGHDYYAAEVNDLLRRVATELDAGRPAGPLIKNATFRGGRGWGWGYDAEAVDWFFDQLLAHQSGTGPAGRGDDPWPDFPVAGYFTWSGPGDLAWPSAEQSRKARGEYESKVRLCFTEDCLNAWRDFGQLPGTYLWWGRAGGRWVLRTAEGQTLFSLRQGYFRDTVSAGGRRFTQGRARSSSPDVAEIAARSTRDIEGHFSFAAKERHERRLAHPGEIRDETGTPILYISGASEDSNARACITFPDERWLRFPVRGTGPGNAIMTAVDEAGNRAVRYRAPGKPKDGVEITVHPDRELTDELVVAIAISAPWLRGQFNTPGGGGG